VLFAPNSDFVTIVLEFFLAAFAVGAALLLRLCQLGPSIFQLLDGFPLMSAFEPFHSARGGLRRLGDCLRNVGFERVYIACERFMVVVLLPQPDARPFAVLSYKDDARAFEGTLQYI
jgi:hypothetical protein